MAKSRSSRNKTRKKSLTKRSPRLLWPIIALGITGAIVALVYLLPLPQGTGPKVRPPFEELDSVPPVSRPSKPSRPKSTASMPLVAILIDDMGYNLPINNQFLKLEAPVSFSFLPTAPHTPTLAKKAKDFGKDVLIHLPLEPVNSAIDPGPGVLRLSMDFDSMLQILRKDLDAVPGAIGVNNHMGSKFTASKRGMELILTEIKRRGLFFVDSKTTHESVAYITARSMGIPAAERTVFLDHDTQKESIRREIKKMVKLSMENGCVLAIGHPTSNTWKVLYEELPRVRKRVRIVPVHKILVAQ
ncbi:MAG: divergent polysaccharide deacetylase family protein [Thermodesulfobacteriota bacterium]|nr:divergent polysaccharide deacetylase family protein [Thermodesulfobacteriota bacterium]